MQRPRRPFEIALLALLLAIGLPAIVFMFGAVRNRQLQSKANPRWAQFAKVTGPTATIESSSSDSGRISVRTASIHSDDPPAETSTHQHLPESNLTGSVTGHSSIELPVLSLPHPKSVPDDERPVERISIVNRQAIIFRPVDEQDEHDQKIAETARRLESQLAQVRRRLDQLAQWQQQHQVDDIQRESKFLDALKRLSDNVKMDDRADETRAKEVPFAESPVNPAPYDEDPITVPRATEPTSPKPTIPASPLVPSVKPGQIEPGQIEPIEEPSESKPDLVPELKSEISAPPVVESLQSDESIRIRRETKGDLSEVFTMEVRDADIRQFFGKLSEAAHVSILPGPEIYGQISLNLRAVSFETALNAILKSRSYVAEREGDIVIISTAHEAAELKHKNRKLVMKIYQPNYLSAAELNRLVEPLLSPDGRHSVSTPTQSGLSSADDFNGDNINQHETLIVQDVAEVLGQIDQILIEMDVPPLQVNIEAKILCVRLSGRLEHGVDLSLFPCQRDSGTSFAEGGFKTASLSCNIPTFIKSIERLADTSVVTSQRIQVLNKHRAEMLIGDRIGYQSKAGDNVRFMESGTRLVFRPSISADGCIKVEIYPERSSVTMTRRTKLPQQNTTELTTQVLVHDGATVAIGGLISEQAIETTSHVPLISSIPVVGAPFRQRNDRLQRTELIVLVTPHIVTECATESDGAALEQAAEERANEFRNQQSHKARHNLARAHYDRASCYLQRGNPVRARQQIEASLNLNKADLDALRLRNEINQCFMHPSVQ